MVVAPDGAVSWSVSGGCIEGAVYEAATEVISSGVPVLQRYGVSDDDAFEVGLTCFGTINVFVEAVSRAMVGDFDGVAGGHHRPPLGGRRMVVPAQRHPWVRRIGSRGRRRRRRRC